jgi:hypothetical protein
MNDDMKASGLNTVSQVHYYYDAQYVKNLQAKIDRNNRKIAALKKEIADLEEELRVKGLPQRWADPK